MQTFLFVGFRQSVGLIEFDSAHEIEQKLVNFPRKRRAVTTGSRRNFNRAPSMYSILKNNINFKVELEQFAIHKFFKSANTAGEQKHDFRQSPRETIRVNSKNTRVHFSFLSSSCRGKYRKKIKNLSLSINLPVSQTCRRILLPLSLMVFILKSTPIVLM